MSICSPAKASGLPFGAGILRTPAPSARQDYRFWGRVHVYAQAPAWTPRLAANTCDCGPAAGVVLGSGLDAAKNPTRTSELTSIGNGKVIKAGSCKARARSPGQTASGPTLDVSGRPQARAGKRKGLSEARDQGGTAEAQTGPAAPLEAGQVQEPAQWPQDERRHLYPQGRVRPARHRRQAG